MNETESDVNDYNVIRGSIVGVTSILIITLGLFSLFVLPKVSSIQDTTKVFLRSMTVANLGVGFVIAVPATLSVICENCGDSTLCGIKAFLGIILTCVSNLSLLILTVDRYISVVHALQYNALVTVRRARIAVCCVWGIGTLLATSLGFLNEWRSIFSLKTMMCVFYLDKVHQEYIQYMMVISLCITTSSLLVVLITYTRLFIISRHHARQINALNNQLALARNQPEPPRPNHKAVHTMLLIVLVACFASLPAVILTFCFSVFQQDSNITVFFLSVFPSLTNSWSNEMIYYLRNAGFRQTARTLVTSWYQYFKRHIPFIKTN